MIKRVTSSITAFLLSVSSLLVFAPSVAHAAVRTWDGSAGDNKFSTASNWSDDAVPTNGDSVVFPLSAASYTDVDIVQDISGLSLSGISFTGDAGSNCNGQYAGYNISGAALTLTGNIDSSTTAGTCWNIGLIKIANLILSGDTVELNQPEGNDGLTIVLGDYSAANTLTIGATNLVITNGYYNLINSKITGSGTISSTTDLALYGDNSGYSGDVNITSGTLNVNHPNALGSGTTAVVIDDGASISLRSFADSATTIARPITLSGAASAGTSKISFGVSHNCPPYIPDITLTGTFTLQNDATY
ncbi:hypothetical protein KDA11_00700 [Candidatus Saccharibacteria bacterium]|nr:hypothetical protein [Candidatus Saccharibacteria bacterium]